MEKSLQYKIFIFNYIIYNLIIEKYYIYIQLFIINLVKIINLIKKKENILEYKLQNIL